MRIALWVVQVILALGFLASGGMKVVTPLDELLKNGMTFVEHFPGWFVRFVGVAEVLAAFGFILPAATRIKPILTPIAAALSVILMVGAAGTHIALGEMNQIVAPLVLAALCAFVAWGRFKKVPIAPR